MFQWLSNRMGRNPQPQLERAPDSVAWRNAGKPTTVPQFVCGSPRRGVTLRPFTVVKFENRRRTRVARASRKANR